MLAENEESVLLLMGLQGHAFGDVKVRENELFCFEFYPRC